MLLTCGEMARTQVVVAIPLYQLEYYDRGKTYTCQQFPLRLAWAVTVGAPEPQRPGHTTLAITRVLLWLAPFSTGPQVAGADARGAGSARAGQHGGSG